MITAREALALPHAHLSEYDREAAESFLRKLDRYAATALVLKASAELVNKMSDEELARRRISLRVVPAWEKEAEQEIYRAAFRRNTLASTGRTHRNVA